MKKTIFFALILITTSIYGQIKSVKPSGKYETSFAIVIDKKTYEKTTASVNAYRDMLLKEGLGAYILIDEGGNADKIRQALIEMYEGTPRLEGCVLIGDIPIVMVRDAQHLSSAFKMDQNMAWARSSIPSDRFYDDFDLQFKFLKKDEKNTLLHYYSLEANSAMRLQSDIYSARIKPPVIENGKSKYEQIDAYLKKVVAERNSTNKLDNLMMFRGHGYNSEAMEAWSGEQVSLREQLPQIFKAGGQAKFLGFESKFPSKLDLLSEIQRENLDVALFHEHGSSDLQYINAYPATDNPTTAIETVKYYLRGKIRAAVRKKKDLNEAVDYYTKYLDVSRDWCDLSDSLNRADSILEYNMDIHLPDLYNIKPNARFVMFDACYNGSFNNDEYIAAAYVFGTGKTIVTLGNSVNSLQDKFPNEFIGLLGQGVRVGLWAKHINYLETHLLGDPTFRFAASDRDLDLNKNLVLRTKDFNYWKSLLNNPNSDVQAIALKILSENNYPQLSALLKDIYFKSEFGAVRMECVNLLSFFNNEDFIEVLKATVTDPYELVRRLGMDYIGRNGSPELLPAIIYSQIFDSTSKRVMYKSSTSLSFYAPEVAIDELNKQIGSNNNLLDKEQTRERIITSISSKAKTSSDYLRDMKNVEGKGKERGNAIRYIRNMNNHYLLSEYIDFAKDESQDLSLRIMMLEALSWFQLSYRNSEIITLCNDILKKSDNEDLKQQAVKTKNIIFNKNKAI